MFNIPIPPKIYRFLPEENYAEALCKGLVWLSTLENCRSYENPFRGDDQEGTEEYFSGTIKGDATDSRVRTVASRLFNSPVQGGHFSISNCKSIRKIPNAFVICTTAKYDPEKFNRVFGSFCVEISFPMTFHELISKRLAEMFSISENAFGPIKYQSRGYYHLEAPPGPIGFVKPQKYKNDHEYRSMWIMKDLLDLKPFLLSVPEIKSFCRRV